jgi:hypothetical protein
MAALNSEVLALIDAARAAGLRLELDGPQLVLSGPRSAKDIALRLLEHKPEILALLRTGYAAPWPEVTPDFRRRSVDAYAPCQDCPEERWSFVRYGDRVTCLPCALDQIESAVVVTTRPPTPKVPA